MRGNRQGIYREADPLVALAGVAWETGCGLGGKVTWKKGEYDDLDEALELIERIQVLRVQVNRAGRMFLENGLVTIQRWILEAGNLLVKHSHAVEKLGAKLAKLGRLSARSVAAILREHGKRGARE